MPDCLPCLFIFILHHPGMSYTLPSKLTDGTPICKDLEDEIPVQLFLVMVQDGIFTSKVLLFGDFQVQSVFLKGV